MSDRVHNVLGISAYYHDSAATLLRDGEILAAAQEKRFSRKKHDARFPAHAIEFCLSEGQLVLRDVDQVVFYDKPLVKFERLLDLKEDGTFRLDMRYFNYCTGLTMTNDRFHELFGGLPRGGSPPELHEDSHVRADQIM